MRTTRFGWLAIPALALAAACPGGGDDAQVPVLDPEPPGAPVDMAGGRLSCLGDNTPPPGDGTSVQLLGWVRAYADPANDTGAPPAASVEVFDENGISVGTGFSDVATGRTAVTVPVRATGFVGTVKVTAAGFVDALFASSRPVTTTDAAGWTWLTTPGELTTLATGAGVVLDPAKALLVGAVHDCDVFGVDNVVVRAGGAGGTTEGVVYFEAFDPAPTRTYSAASGRFAVPNLDPGPITVEAFARSEPGGPLELFSRVDVIVEAGVVTAVDLQPRMGVER